MRAFPILAAIALSLTPTRSAEACSPPICWGGSFVPGDGATVPANVPALYWRPVENTFGGGKVGDPARIRFYAADAPSTALGFVAQPADFGDYLLLPDQPLIPGTTYVLEDGNTCQDNPGPRITFVAGPSAPLPNDLGAVALVGDAISQQLEVANDGGMCSVTVDAMSLSIELAPSASAEPWMAMLFFETHVDGMRWYAATSINSQNPPGASWHGRGRDLLYRICTANQQAINGGLASGGHEVLFRASLPGSSSTALVTSEKLFELVCDGDGSGEGSGSGSGSGDGDGDDDTADGGGCATTSGATSIVAFVVGLALVRTRRRSRRAT